MYESVKSGKIAMIHIKTHDAIRTHLTNRSTVAFNDVAIEHLGN